MLFDWSQAATDVRLLGDVAIAMFLGGLIGLEREAADKSAGFRTHTLVAGAAAFMVGLSPGMVEALQAEVDDDLIRADPFRLVEAVVTGVSFVAAGNVIRHGGRGLVSGLTTAGSILLCGAIGIGIALHRYVLAAGVTGLTVIVLLALANIDARFRRGRRASGAAPEDDADT